MFFKCLIMGHNWGKLDFNLIVSSFDLFLTTVYIKRTHQAVTTKITNSIINEFHQHVFWVLKRTVSSKHFFWMPKHNFTIEGKQPKPRFGCLKGPSHRDGSFKHPKSYVFAEIKEKLPAQKSTQRRATNGLPGICHLNSLSLVGRWWPDVVC